MYAPATEFVMEDFKITSSILGSFTVTMYVLGFAIGPMIIAPCSELYGRRIVYHISGLVFVICNLGCGFSNSIAMLFVFRFLAGCAGSAPQTVGGGTISDVVPIERRGAAMAVFGLGPLFGPVIGESISRRECQRSRESKALCQQSSSYSRYSIC
jgi:MFS family permease